MPGNRIAFVALAFALSSVLSAAVDAADKSKPAKPDVRGTVTSVKTFDKDVRAKGTLGVVLIEGPRDPAVTYDKAHARITDKTKIEKLVGKERKPATVDDLKRGQRVEGWFTGAVAESYPVQATARHIVILEDPK